MLQTIFQGFQTSEEIISCSRSNSKAEDRRTGFHPDMNYSTPNKMFQTNETVPMDLHSHVNGSSLSDERFTQWHQQSEDPRLERFCDILQDLFVLEDSTKNKGYLHLSWPDCTFPQVSWSRQKVKKIPRLGCYSKGKPVLGTNPDSSQGRGKTLPMRADQ